MTDAEAGIRAAALQEHTACAGKDADRWQRDSCKHFVVCMRSVAGTEGGHALKKLAGVPHWLLTMTLCRGWYLQGQRSGHAIHESDRWHGG